MKNLKMKYVISLIVLAFLILLVFNFFEKNNLTDEPINFEPKYEEANIKEDEILPEKEIINLIEDESSKENSNQEVLLPNVYLPIEFDDDMFQQLNKKVGELYSDGFSCYGPEEVKLIQGSFIEPFSNEYLLIVDGPRLKRYFGIFDENRKLISINSLDLYTHSGTGQYLYACKKKGINLLLYHLASRSNGDLDYAFISLNSFTSNNELSPVQSIFNDRSLSKQYIPSVAFIENNKINIYEWKMENTYIGLEEFKEKCKKPECIDYDYGSYESRKGYLMYEKTMTYDENECLFK